MQHPDWISSPGLDRENDESLRARCLACWKGLGGANAAAYTAWAKSVEGVGLVLPVPLFRGLGTVDVMITGTGNIPPGEALVAQVQEAMDARKPIGTDVLVREPEDVVIDIRLEIMAGQNLSKDAALETIDRYFREIGIGEGYESSKLSALLFASLSGVKKISFSGEQSIPNLPKEIARKGAVHLEIVYGGL